MLTPFRVSTCMFQNSTPRVLKSVTAASARVYTAPYWCSDNTWNTFLLPYSVTTMFLNCYNNIITVLMHIRVFRSVWMLIYNVKLKNYRCWYNKVLSECLVTVTSKCSVLLTNQFCVKNTCTVIINSDILFLYLDLCSITSVL